MVSRVEEQADRMKEPWGQVEQVVQAVFWEELQGADSKVPEVQVWHRAQVVSVEPEQ